MSETKKFLLIDPSNVDKLSHLISDQVWRKNDEKQQLSERLQPIHARELQALDRSMLDIVNNNKLSETEKVKAYNNALTEFRDINNSFSPIKQQPPQSVQPPISKPQKSSDNKNDKSYNSMLGIPKMYQNKAANLLQFLTETGNLKVLPSGIVVIHDKEIKNSNITDMINKAVNPNRLNNEVPGWTTFQSLVKSSNTPKALLHNKFSSIKDETSTLTDHTSRSSPTISYKNKKYIRNWLQHDSTKAKKKKEE